MTFIYHYGNGGFGAPSTQNLKKPFKRATITGDLISLPNAPYWDLASTKWDHRFITLSRKRKVLWAYKEGTTDSVTKHWPAREAVNLLPYGYTAIFLK